MGFSSNPENGDFLVVLKADGIVDVWMEKTSIFLDPRLGENSWKIIRSFLEGEMVVGGGTGDIVVILRTLAYKPVRSTCFFWEIL